jgi:hypothetical protein
MLTIGDVQEEPNLALSIKTLSMALLEEFWVLVAKFTVCDKLYVLSRVFFSAFNLVVYVYVTANYDLRLRISYRDFRVASSLLRDSLMSPERALYMLNIQ